MIVVIILVFQQRDLGEIEFGPRLFNKYNCFANILHRNDNDNQLLWGSGRGAAEAVGFNTENQ